MRLHAFLALALIVPNLSFAQSREAPSNTDLDRSSLARELREFHDALFERREQIKRQPLEVERLEQQLARNPGVTVDVEPTPLRMVDGALHAVQLPDAESLICYHRRAQKCARQHDLCRFLLRRAIGRSAGGRTQAPEEFFGLEDGKKAIRVWLE